MNNLSGTLHPQVYSDARQREADNELLDRIQRAAFACLLQSVNRTNGLVADTTRSGSPSSIAVTGFALSCYPVAVEHGWISRAEAVSLTLAAMRFFSDSSQSDKPDATGYRGFYYHFLDMETG